MGSRALEGRAGRGAPVCAALVVFLAVISTATPASAGGSSIQRSQEAATGSETPEIDHVERDDDANGPELVLPDLPPEPKPLPEDPAEIAELRPAAPPAAQTEPVSIQRSAPIVFPLAQGGEYGDSFGAPRDGGARRHQGIDIFAPKMTPVVAAASGTVSLLRAGVGTDCCVIRLRHDDGTSSLYLHLNNDTEGTDDGLGYGIADGIALGTHVEAGQVIGYVGDSGNAEETPPHLHFEYHDPSGAATDPYPVLLAAQGTGPQLFAADDGDQETLPYTGTPLLAFIVGAAAALGSGTWILRRTEVT